MNTTFIGVGLLGHARAIAALAIGLGAGLARATDWAPALDRPLAQQASLLAQGAASALRPNARIEIAVGTLATNLKLAPCSRIEPQWPAGARAWGRTRVALRCTQGPSPWTVYLPITVMAWAPSPVAAADLKAGTVLQTQHLRLAEVDWAAGPEAPIGNAESAVGRTLARALPAGQALRASDLHAQQWFAAGDSVRIIARGTGYEAAGTGEALAAGLDGRAVRVRTESGRIVVGKAVAKHRVEMAL